MMSFFIEFANAAPTPNFNIYNQNPEAPGDLAHFACIVVKLVLDFVPYIIVIAIGAFLMGLIKYVGHGDNEEKKSEGRKMMIYGIVGFFFMVSIWGILGIFTRSFGLEANVPQFKGAEGQSFKTLCVVPAKK